MNAEAISPVELEPEKNSPPTTLNLFHHKDPEMDMLKGKVAAVLQLGENINRTELSLNKLSLAKDARLDRLNQTKTELSEQLINTMSSATYGAVYLKMRDELPDLSPNDFMKFFNLCLRINTLSSKQTINSVGTRGSQATLLKSLSRMHAGRTSLENDKTLDRMIMDPPEWFSGNKKSWQMFVMHHANFTVYLNPDLFQSLASHPSSLLSKDIFNREETLLGYTKEGEFPDWVLERSGIMPPPIESGPTKEEVEEELAEDKEQEIKIIEAHKKISEQGDYLVSTSAEKAQKATERLRKLTREVFPSFQNFSDVVLFAKVAGTEAVNLNIGGSSLDAAIKIYTSPASPEYVLTNQEPIALFIEKKLKEGKIIQSAQDPIDTHFINLFSAAFGNIKAQQKDRSEVSEFETLRATNKKAYNVLKDDLKPFVGILTADDISLLYDLLSESKDKPMELFIWDLAGAVSSNFKKNGHMPNSRALQDLGKFSASFLRNHSRWAYQQLQEGLAGKNQEPAPTNMVTVSDVQEEIESTTQEIAQGNLGGWQIFYTDNRSLDERHLIEIGGQKLEEREEALKIVLLKEANLPSIKIGSIIRAFDSLVTVPKEVEQVRVKKDIGGDEFKKLKRAGLRIFYDMDPQEKRLIFFLHQKQAWKYGF